jgi:hypothetical protein
MKKWISEKFAFVQKTVRIQATKLKKKNDINK